ncbi:HK97-gp10 family putative phage morphogenesis protein [Peribacillus kribbensis]|uniref:HK97-gp10 family putative phage morphogenesis protein n=1 Tax=Peribacillus kribbensis TaxID=356658 RepID=UPI00042561A2|nr:HK97-gp10 family putative phage morphogenesis protein [Peribacillus kribbensis]
MPLELTGMNEILQRLNSLSHGAHTQRAIDKALRAGANHLKGKLAENTPKSTQTLRHAADNIVVEMDGDRILIGYHKDHFYMQFVEFGTKKMTANPVVARTFEQEMSTVQRLMKDTLRRELNL